MKKKLSLAVVSYSLTNLLHVKLIFLYKENMISQEQQSALKNYYCPHEKHCTSSKAIYKAFTRGKARTTDGKKSTQKMDFVNELK